ncbi:hypothetical protein B0A48_14497 [Cryoendolithus antarcticus]|uniref:NYN domain-containing protein n=1 Tax=Cryoendolithus antarcticus TaxID=1507870 RepID=A0A1V8SL19_9PEZI|nr:hypothetical protein B0A48_14497 [Cryoendolithus antarcticus]
MSTLSKSKPWDFSHVLDLVNTLSSPKEENKQLHHAVTLEETPRSRQQTLAGLQASSIGQDVEVKDFAKPAAGLGDFAKLWQYMGVPPSNASPLQNGRTGTPTVAQVTDYTSDGATYVKPTRKELKAVTWEDPVSAEDLTGGTTTDRSASPDDISQLTKSQRKKQRRRERKEKEAASSPTKGGVVSESEADVVQRRTPAKQASIHATDAYSRYNLRPRSAGGSATFTPAGVVPNTKLLPASVAPKKAAAKDLSNTQQISRNNKASDAPSPAKASAKSAPPPPVTPAKSNLSAASYGQYNIAKAVWEHTPQPTPTKSRLVPSSVQPPKKEAAISSQAPVPQTAIQSAVNAVQAAMQMPGTPSKKSNIIEPKLIRSGEDRNWALFLRLLNEHPTERKHLVAPMNMTTHNSDPAGIHVFVDASNIFIGFNDQLKRERGMPIHWHTTNANLSFDALALLMERRRPVAKRVLVGSTPSVPAFDTARAVGYEVSLLDKVYKARELTERQLYFRDLDAARGKRVPKITSTPNGHTHTTSSGSETTGPPPSTPQPTTPIPNGPQFAPAKMIEQGVDEILHLKILESIVDTEVPSTMVLATGDAAQAEYSQGFMAMAERALKKGWKVEVVSWSKNVSQMYLRREFRERWGEAFKVVWLDEYAEELLDV